VGQGAELAVSEAGGARVLDFAALYRSQWRPMLRVAQGLVDDVNSAEDVVQEAFVALYRKRATLQDPAVAARYLRVSVINGARSVLRRRRTVRAHLSIVRATDHEPGADHEALLSAEQAAVRETLSALPLRQREVLTLRFVCDLNDEEIARTTGMSPASVRAAASRRLTALRAAIGGKA
jgi:RNA polymerase sigma factor (sigma-70 family)